MKYGKHIGQAVLIAALIAVATMSDAKTVRATMLSSADLKDLATSSEEIVIEFRQNDQIPLNFIAEGDFIETVQPISGLLRVKENFWLKVTDHSVVISLDGTNFKPLSEVASGALSAGAGEQGGLADAVNVLLKMERKK